jgi:integrase
MSILAVFLSYQHDSGKHICASTLRAYKYLFAECDNHPLPLTAEKFTAVYLARARLCNSATINRYRKQLISLYKILKETGNAIEPVDFATRMINREFAAITKTELKTAIQPRAFAFTPIEVRNLYSMTTKGSPDRLLLVILLTTGLRVGGVKNLRTDCIAPGSGSTIEKGGRVHQFSICSELQTELTVHIERFGGSSMYIFPSRQSLLFPCTTAKLQKRFRLICHRAGIEQANVHRTRHTVAQALRSAGRAEYLIQRFLGHQSAKTTAHYGEPPFSQVISSLRLPWLPATDTTDPCELLYSLCPNETSPAPYGNGGTDDRIPNP